MSNFDPSKYEPIDSSKTLFLDFDARAASAEQVLQDAQTVVSHLRDSFGIDEEAISIFDTGNKGIHILIDLHKAGIVVVDDATSARRYAEMLAVQLPIKTLDTHSAGNRMVLKNGEENPKTGRRKVRITHEDLFAGLTVFRDAEGTCDAQGRVPFVDGGAE